MADLEGSGRTPGIPYEDPDTGVWLVARKSGSVRPATGEEVMRQLTRELATQRRINESALDQEAK